MRVSYLNLMNAMARIELPEPEEIGQIFTIAIDDRVATLNAQRGHGMDPKAIKYTQLKLEAMPYGDGAQRWLEWEIIF